MPRKHRHRKHNSHHSSVNRHDSHDWGYGGEDGPHSWPHFFPEGKGLHQSPINIDTSAPYVRYDDSLAPLVINYERCQPLSIFNSGHGFQVKVDENSPAIVTGGPFKNDEYQLAQFHGHWGKSNNEHGSEHTINGRSFPSELHFVHVNKKYGGLQNAVHHPDGLAVIGVFIKITEKRHQELQKLIEDFKLIDYDNHDVALDFDVHPRDFLPADISRYFTYQGSLTTPPLSECVVWMLMADSLEISSDQMSPFHELHAATDGKRICHNFRPVQPLNDRIVRASFAGYKNCSITDAPIND